MRTTITRSHYPIRPVRPVGPVRSLVRPVADPFSEFDALIRTAFGGGSVTAGFQPAVETLRDGDDAVLRFELPGIDVARDVTVEVKGRDLVVSGERRDERESEDAGRRVSEFRYGAFRRSFRLAAGVTADAVSASYDAGVLTVRVAGAYAESAGQQVAITTGSPVGDSASGEAPEAPTDTVPGEVEESHEG